MSDLVKSLTGALAKPTTIEQQNRGRTFFLDEHSTAVPNEGNMLTLLTMKDLFKSETAATNAIDIVAKEESRYLVQAMKILSSDPNSPWKDADGNDHDLTAAQAKTITKMQNKFGKDLEGSKELSKLLKIEAVRVEFEDSIKEFVGSKIRSQSGGALAGASVLN